MSQKIQIGTHDLSDDSPAYIVAELSANHNGSLARAKQIIAAAADAGADAVKLQTYKPDTITMESHAQYFHAHGLWEGQTLYELYQQAYTPWEWHKELIAYAADNGLDCFSSPFDPTAVDFLEELGVPAYKVASFEINDIPLLRKIAAAKKPIILSTGIAWLEDIDLAVRTCLNEGNDQLMLLKCVSAYPAPFEHMNLRNLPQMHQTFGCLTGLSDHSLGDEAAIAGVTLGAKMIEKHLTLNRADGGPDAAFSMEPGEFAQMVKKIRNVEAALGSAAYTLNADQIKSRKDSRSLFIAENMKKGDFFSTENLKSVRPGVGLHTKYFSQLLGQRAACDLTKGTPMAWNYIDWNGRPQEQGEST